MSTISKQLSGILFNGAALALASAPWKNNVRAIYGFNGAGNGYTLFKPTSNFNSLTQLQQDGAYIVDAATLGFELPGATMVAGAGASTGSRATLSVTRAVITNVTSNPGSTIGYVRAELTVHSTDRDDMAFLVYYSPTVSPGIVYSNQESTIQLGFFEAGSEGTFTIYNRQGVAIEHQFVVPAAEYRDPNAA
ncbi:hypothetical protein KBK19_16980 [Microvirga sp. STR05]|uniref:Uncharacterized protein n=1 Tax=Hymenobacter duratus TaxID=2771356 RepID=A0ABR8JKU8_9BACT|nr:hypothetical protein [Hymenobacter duratus]MBD2716742.1 hypothetical protein [Hymenobacter duratus]MBR7951657.1 hypothetical protein [Microvirga sp. STR05]